MSGVSEPHHPAGEARASRRGRVIAFAVLVFATAAVAVGFVTRAAMEAGGDDASAGTAAASAAVRLAGSHVIFRSLDRGRQTFGRVAVARDAGSRRTHVVTGMSCERLHMAGGRGLCLTQRGRLFGVYRAVVFGREFRPSAQLNLNGIPTRTRVSPDGRYGAATTFVSGHSYANVGEFSTETVLIDLQTGTKLGNLEDFVVMRDGRRFRRQDFNFWGVTFARGGNRFYATLASGGETYLIEGDLRARSARVLRENVECPSLSPDGTRIAYKKLVGGPGDWRFHVLDLRTMEDTPLAEERHIDDQLEWLDDERLLYRAEDDVWTVRADGTGAPRRFLTAADSPAVVRVRG
jgi:hypothetical protein